jgi:starvation-inducible DNA-binding protein
MTVTDSPRLVPAIDASLCDLINLGLLAKQAHWNLHGPAFRSLHLLLDEVADFARNSGDELAERAIARGHNPDGRAATVAHGSSLDLAPGPIADVDVIHAFDEILDTIINRLHHALDAASEDPVTADLLTGIAAALEKLAWMIRAHR